MVFDVGKAAALASFENQKTLQQVAQMTPKSLSAPDKMSLRLAVYLASRSCRFCARLKGVTMNERVSSRLNLAELRELLDANPVAHLSGVYRAYGKRVLDVVLVLVAAAPALVILLPLMALIALDGRAPIYSQKRIGRNGRLFRIFKLRTMVADADQILEAYLARTPEARGEWNENQKLKADPRITFFGKVLRKSSLDELPQLLNVLLGHMSLVGPRPMMLGQEDLYPGRAYYEMRPGITGYWQVSERNETSFPQRAEYDTAYYKSLSFGTDVKVMLCTLRVVVRGTGY